MNNTSEWLSSFASQNLNQLEKNKKTTVVSITGGKGGVGKTSLALRICKEKAAQGHKVLLIDCDYNLANTSIKLGLPVSNNFYDLISSTRTFESCVHKMGNFHLLSACNGSLDLFEKKFELEKVIVDIINEHGQEYDYIYLDCPAGLTRETLVLNAYSDKRIFVVIPDKSSITDSYSLIKILNQKFGVSENHLLINMIDNKSQYVNVVKTLSETIENFLGGRTHILTGIKRYPSNIRDFDKFFLDNGNNDLVEKINKVIEKLVDEESGNRFTQHIVFSKSNLKHDVLTPQA